MSFQGSGSRESSLGLEGSVKTVGWGESGGIQECEEGANNKLPHRGCGSSIRSGRTTDRAAAVTASLPLSNAGPLTSGAAILADGALG